VCVCVCVCVCVYVCLVIYRANCVCLKVDSLFGIVTKLQSDKGWIIFRFLAPKTFFSSPASRPAVCSVQPPGGCRKPFLGGLSSVKLTTHPSYVLCWNNWALAFTCKRCNVSHIPAPTLTDIKPPTYKRFAMFIIKDTLNCINIACWLHLPIESA